MMEEQKMLANLDLSNQTTSEINSSPQMRLKFNENIYPRDKDNQRTSRLLEDESLLLPNQ